MELKALIAECTAYDFKVMLEERKPKSWLKSVSAFANGLGGSLFFGIDNDGVVKGLDDVQHVCETISSRIRDYMDPLPELEMIPHDVDGLHILQIKVNAGHYTPYYYVGDGQRIAFVRVGDESLPATAEQMVRLVLKGSNKTFDSLHTDYKAEDYSSTTRPEFTTTYTYNSQNDLVAVTSTNGTSKAMSYDTYGRLETSIERATNDIWLRKDYTYASGNVSTITYTSQNGLLATENYTYTYGHFKEGRINNSTVVYRLMSENAFGQPTKIKTGPRKQFFWYAYLNLGYRFISRRGFQLRAGVNLSTDFGYKRGLSKFPAWPYVSLGYAF